MITVEVHTILLSAAQRDRQQQGQADEARRELVQRIRWASDGGATYREIGEAIGLTAGRISQILKKDTA